MSETFVYTLHLVYYKYSCVLTAFSIRVSLLGSKIHNRDDTPKDYTVVFTLITPLSKGETGEDWEPSNLPKGHCSYGYQEALHRKSFRIFLTQTSLLEDKTPVIFEERTPKATLD